MIVKLIAVIAVCVVFIAACIDARAASGADDCVASVVKAGGPTAANSAVPFSAPEPGMRYLVQGGYFQIASVDGMTVKTVNASNKTATWLAGMIYGANSMDKATVEAIWPLEIGKKVTFAEQAGEDVLCHTVTIAREETTAISAGNFDTMVIEDRLRSLRTEQGTLDVTRTYWYAPSVHWVVKRELTQVSGAPYKITPPYAVTQIVVASEGPKIETVSWPKIDCSAAHFVLPFTQPRDCFKGPIIKGDDSSCHIGVYETAGGDNIKFEIYLYLAGGRCGVCFPGDDVARYIKSATAVSRDGRDFSDSKRFGNTHVMSFSGRGKKGPVDCFAFATIGPTVRRTESIYRYTLRGHVCKEDGTKLNDSEIAQLASGIGTD